MSSWCPGGGIPLPEGQPASAAAAKALESTKPGLSPTAEVEKSAHPLPWGAEGQLSRDTKPLCTLRCAVRAGDIGAGMLTLIPEQPQGRVWELSWVVSEVGAEPWTLRKVCLQNTDSGDL